MSNAVAKKEQTQVAMAQAPAPGGEELLSSSIVIPKLLLMQGLSEFVNERKAQQGDMVRSTNGEVLGGPTKPVEFIPITFNHTWVLQEKIGGKYEYRGQEPMTAANQDLPWEFKQNGADWKRVKSLNVYALLPQDIAAEQAELEKAKSGEMPDPDKALLPVLITFRSTGFTAGKDVVTHFAKARKFGLPGYVSTMKLSCHQDKNDKGTYYVFEVKSSGRATPEQQEVAKYWQGVLATQKVQVDESDEKGSSGGEEQF